MPTKRYFLLTALVFISPAAAEVKLPSVIGSDMVLQRDLAAPLWGWADPGERIELTFAGQTKSTEADEDGVWMVKLDPLKASSEGRELQIVGGNKIVLRNVLVGDVWVCSGQSNMEWRVGQAMQPQEEIAAAKYPRIRLFDVPGHITSPTPRDNCPGSWKVCSPQTVGGFSAVGYFFGRELHEQGEVPIGLIGTNWGGTRIEPWTPPVGFRSVPQLQAIAASVDRFDPEVAAGKATWNEHISQVEAWAARARKALDRGRPLPPAPTAPGFTASGQPTAIYNAMVHPLAPFGIRGAIWYQGESNGTEGVEYFHKMQALIEGWRKVWDQGDFPIHFYFVQLANWQQPTDDPAGGNGWARLREAQRRALAIPHTGMAVTIDIGEAGDIHPRNKQDVGKRLARWALRDVYEKDLVVSGPLYREMKVEQGKVRLLFDHADSGLMVGRKQGLRPTEPAEGELLQRFAVAGKDRQWRWATAAIDGNSVVVFSEDVPEPVAVRYAYSMNPEGANLYNKEGLPASPFRTDDW